MKLVCRKVSSRKEERRCEMRKASEVSRVAFRAWVMSHPNTVLTSSARTQGYIHVEAKQSREKVLPAERARTSSVSHHDV